MADDDVIIRRRELRRRKILENSEQRLTKLASCEVKSQANVIDEDRTCNSVGDEIPRESHSDCNTVTNELKKRADCKGFQVEDNDYTANRAIPSVSNDINTLPKILSENKSFTKKTNTTLVGSETSFLLKSQQKLILKPIVIWRKWISFFGAILILLSNYILGEFTLNKFLLTPITTFEIVILIAECLIEDENRRQVQSNAVAAMFVLLGGRKGAQFLHLYNVFALIFEDYAIFIFTYFMSYFWIETIAC